MSLHVTFEDPLLSPLRPRSEAAKVMKRFTQSNGKERAKKGILQGKSVAQSHAIILQGKREPKRSNENNIHTAQTQLSERAVRDKRIVVIYCMITAAYSVQYQLLLLLVQPRIFSFLRTVWRQILFQEYRKRHRASCVLSLSHLNPDQ